MPLPPDLRHALRLICWLLWKKPDSTWACRLTALPGERTRLVTRVKARYDWNRPALALLSCVLMEFGDFAMMRRMLLGIRDRAESFQIQG